MVDRQPQEQISEILSEEIENIMISLLQESTKYFSAVANLKEKTFATFNTVSKSMNDLNNKITGNDETLTELFNNLLLEITTKNKTLVDNITRVRNTSNYNSDNVNEQVEKRKRLHYQIYRSQQL